MPDHNFFTDHELEILARALPGPERTDCEGLIGPVTSAKIADAMRRGRPVFVALWGPPTPPDLEWGAHFVNKYDEWLKAFEMAADGGCVDFH